MEAAEFDYLPIASVAEILYCPRNFYYRAVQNIELRNAAMMKGHAEDENRGERSTVKREEYEQRRQVTVASERLGLIGKIDVVEEGEDVYPVEYKTGKLGPKENDDVQLCAQGMVLEEVLGRPINQGYLYYAASHRRRVVPFTEELRQKVIETTEQAREILSGAVIPEPVADARCRGCSLAPLCLPEETAYLTVEKAPPPRRVIPGLQWGRVLYVDAQGAYVRKRHGRLVVEKDKEVLHEMPAVNVDQVVLVGNVQLSTQAAQWLIDLNIPVQYLSLSGRYKGEFSPGVNRNSLLRLAQFRVHEDEAGSLNLAKAFVRGKVANMRARLLRRQRETGDQELAQPIRELKAALRRVERAQGRAELLGVEGSATRTYFSVFSRMVDSSELLFDFEKRTRRPPRDPVNALLSFAYSILTSDLVTACRLAGLDPYIGFYHSDRYGRPALALDLVEELRPVLADGVVLALINRGEVTESHFEEKEGGWYLNQRGRAGFFAAYGRRKQQEIRHPVFGYRIPYYRLPEMQARFLAKALTGELPDYQPFVVK